MSLAVYKIFSKKFLKPLYKSPAKWYSMDSSKNSNDSY